jgi:hypothetical protein
MRNVPAAPGLLLATLLALGCGGPSGECTGTVGAAAIRAELGGDTKLALTESLTSRVALMVLDYGDGAFFVDTIVSLPAEQGPTQIPFGPGTPQRPVAEGLVPRFLVTRPESVPAIRSGVMTVALTSSESVEGSFDVEFEDASTMHCTFDVSGKTNIEDDQVPIEPPLGPTGLR